MSKMQKSESVRASKQHLTSAEPQEDILKQAMTMLLSEVGSSETSKDLMKQI